MVVLLIWSFHLWKLPFLIVSAFKGVIFQKRLFTPPLGGILGPFNGLQGRFEIDLTGEIGMDVDNVMVDDDDDGDEVRNAKDLQMLERLRVGNDNEDNIPPSDSVDYFDMVDSDDETYDLANPDHEDYL